MKNLKEKKFQEMSRRYLRSKFPNSKLRLNYNFEEDFEDGIYYGEGFSFYGELSFTDLLNLVKNDCSREEVITWEYYANISKGIYASAPFDYEDPRFGDFDIVYDWNKTIRIHDAHLPIMYKMEDKMLESMDNICTMLENIGRSMLGGEE